MPSTNRRLTYGVVLAVACLAGTAGLLMWRARAARMLTTRKAAEMQRLGSFQLQRERLVREKHQRARQQAERDKALNQFPGLADLEAKQVFFVYEDGCPIFVSFANVVPLPSDDQLEGLAQFKTLRTISLERAPISGRGFAYLESLPLEAIALTETLVDDNGLAVIASFSQLEELYLSRTLITDQGIDLVAHLPRLRKLSLAGTSIGNASVQHLRRITSLESLDLMGTAIDSGDVLALQVLPNLKHLTLDKRLENARDTLEAALPGCKISFR
ncbi:MAG: hypothetical protein AB7O68_16645 [Pirellulales bacterium]